MKLIPIIIIVLFSITHILLAKLMAKLLSLIVLLKENAVILLIKSENDAGIAG